MSAAQFQLRRFWRAYYERRYGLSVQSLLGYRSAIAARSRWDALPGAHPLKAYGPPLLGVGDIARFSREIEKALQRCGRSR